MKWFLESLPLSSGAILIAVNSLGVVCYLKEDYSHCALLSALLVSFARDSFQLTSGALLSYRDGNGSTFSRT